MNWLSGKIDDITYEQYNIVYSALSLSRKAHIDGMNNTNAKKCSLMASYLLEKLLRKMGKSGLKPEMDEAGKPYLRGSDLFVSISHSHDFVVCALSDKPVGIDVEKIRPVSLGLVEYVCNEKEREYILSSENRCEVDTVSDEAAIKFFSVWTAKEAFFKRGDSNVKNIRKIDTLVLKKQEFIIDGYYITVL